MGASLDVYSAYGVQFPDETSIESVMEDLTTDGSSDFEDYAFRIMRKKLDLPDIPEWCPDYFSVEDEQREKRDKLINEWRASEDGAKYDKIRNLYRRTLAEFNVDIGNYGTDSYSASLLYYTPSLSSGEGCAWAKRHQDDVVDKAKLAIIKFVEFFELNEFSDFNYQDVDLLIWASYG